MLLVIKAKKKACIVSDAEKRHAASWNKCIVYYNWFEITS